MKAVMRKVGEITLSVLLVSLICLPVPAISAFAEEADGETQAESELTPEQLLKLKQLQAAQAEDAEASDSSTEASETEANEPANADETTATDEADADSKADETTTPDGMTDTDKAAEIGEGTDALTPDAEQPANDIATTEKAAKAASADASTVSTADELAAAFATANAYAGSGTYTITLADDIDLPTNMSVAAGKNVTLAGDGHTLTLEGSAALDVNGTLTLDGGLTVAAGGSHTGTMVVVNAGTLNMNSGVTIEGNDDDTAVTGGGVSVTNKGTFNMNGGTIENCAADKGGGVYVIASTFNMSGDATIRDCRTQTDSVKDTGNGGGVFLDTGKNPGTIMTMSGNATIRDNSAVGVGGGVFVNTRATLTMEGNASIVSNAADAAGGVMNYGRATLTAVYGNTARQGADDIFNNARAQLKLSPTNPEWVLPRTGTHVTGWYKDYYHAVDETGSQGDGGHRWAPENDDSVEYVPTDGFTTEMLTLTAGAPLVTVIWENEDGTILYEMNNLQPADVPAADEFTELSGQDEPTEPDTAEGQSHEFTGWTETRPSEDEVIYIANYKLVDTHEPNEVVETPTAPTVDDPTAPAVIDPTNGDTTPTQAGTYSGTASDNTSAAGASLQQTGDQVGYAGAAFAALMGLSVIALGAAIAIRKRAK